MCTLTFKVFNIRYDSACSFNGILQHIIGHVISKLNLQGRKRVFTRLILDSRAEDHFKVYLCTPHVSPLFHFFTHFKRWYLKK